MNYIKDTTRLSVLVVAFLLVGSAFTFLPAFASTGSAVTKAAISSPSANGSPPSTVGAPNVMVGAVATDFAVDVTNPASNAYAIVSFTVLAPSGWSFAGAPTCGKELNQVGAVSSSAVQCTIMSGGAGLPPGFTDVLQLGTMTGPSSTASSAPTLGTFSTLVVDSSSASSYAGSSFSEWTIAATTLTTTVSATSFTAGGSALTVTTTLSSGQAGVPLTWNFSNPNYPSSSYTASLSPSSTTTTASGATSSFTPSNHAGDITKIVAYVGNGLELTAQVPANASSAAVTTVAGAPSEVSFYFTYAGTTYSSDYLTTPINVGGTLYAEAGAAYPNELSMALSDAYSNAVPLSAAITGITLSASGGYFLYIGGTLAGTTTSSLSCGASNGELTTAYCKSGSAGIIQFPIPSADVVGAESINYIQSSVYGAVGALSGIITTATASYSGSSGNIITSTLVNALAAPTLSGVNIGAGSSLTLSETIQPIAGLYQEGVPITLNLCADCAGTSTGYDSTFSSGSQSITLYTNSTGSISTSLAVNVTLGSTAVFNATALAPTSVSPTATLASADTAAVTTQVGALSTLVVNIAFGTAIAGHPGPNIQYSVSSGTAYVDVAYADAYGNLIPTADAPSNQVQIGLSATNGGLLSATNVYIAGTDVSTNATAPVASFGPIEITMPSTVGTTVVVTATGVVAGKSVSGTASVTVVSASPTMNVTSPIPVSGYLYANTTEVTFKGFANATEGNATTTISTIGYQVGTSGWESVATPALHSVTWAIPIVLVAGVNTVTFNVTDSNSLTTVLAPYTVLVDTTAPTFSAITNAGTSIASLNITSSEGDLNASSVSAWANGTAIVASDISVTGTNNPGSSVTYAVTISGLALGTWSLEVEATTLAGTSATTTQTVTVTVPISPTTFTFPAPSTCTLGTYTEVVCVQVTNTQTGTATGVVLAVITNSAGVTQEVSTSTVSVPGSSSQTAYVILNLPAGSYTAKVFVWSTTGAPLSAPSAVPITLS